MKIYSLYFEDSYTRSFSTRELAEQFIATLLIAYPGTTKLDYWITEANLDEMKI